MLTFSNELQMMWKTPAFNPNECYSELALAQYRVFPSTWKAATSLNTCTHPSFVLLLFSLPWPHVRTLEKFAIVNMKSPFTEAQN